jgi:hypothetical protein
MSKVFTESDYNSDNGILTSIWGPSLWHSLHCISFNYPVNPTEADKKNYKAFVMSLRHVLPCRYCRDNFCVNLKETPLTNKALSSRKEFSKWMFNFHQTVNKCLGKKNNFKFSDIRERYEHFRARCGSSKQNKKTKIKKHKGCTDSIYGVKAKCLLRIVPKKEKKVTFKMDKNCKKKRT